VFLRGGAAMLAQGTSETSGANVESLQARFRAVGQEIATDAVLAAVATGWAMGISPELISAGLDTFVPDLPQ
jgi:cyanophycin synthetase